MKNTIFGFVLAASVVMTGAAFAQEPGGQTNTANPGGLGNSLNNTGTPTQIGQRGGTSGSCRGVCYDYKNADGNAQAIVTNFNQKISAMQLAIIEAMRLSTGQLSGNMREQSGANHNLADQQDDRAVVNSIEQARQRAIEVSATGATSCNVVTGSRGGNAAREAREYAQHLANSLDDYLYGDEQYPSAQGQSVGMLARLEVHCGSYATQSAVTAQLCDAVGERAGADTNSALSIFHKEGNVRAGYSAETAQATQAFLINAFASHTYSPIDPSEANTIEGREKMAIRMAQSARGSIAREAASRYVSERAALTTDSQLVSWAQDNAREMAGFQGADFSNGVSNHDYLEIMSKNFLLKDKTLMNAQQTTDMAIKDIMNMTAVQTYQGYEQYAMLERIGVTLAAILEILNQNTRTDIIQR